MYVRILSVKQLRKPDVIEKPNVQLDEQNAITASGENGDAVANLNPTDPNVNPPSNFYKCKQTPITYTQATTCPQRDKMLPTFISIEQNKELGQDDPSPITSCWKCKSNAAVVDVCGVRFLQIQQIKN